MTAMRRLRHEARTGAAASRAERGQACVLVPLLLPFPFFFFFFFLSSSPPQHVFLYQPQNLPEYGEVREYIVMREHNDIVIVIHTRAV